MTRQAFEDAERRPFAHYGLACQSRSLALHDPAVSIYHAPFLDDPQRCAALIRKSVSRPFCLGV